MALTFSEAKRIPIIDYLSGVGIKPAKIRANEYWYHSPFRHERTPSFKVDIKKNFWYDHGTGEGGTIIDLGAKLYQCSLYEFLEKLSQGNYSLNSFAFHKQNFQAPENKLEVLCVKDIANGDLLNYITSRKIETELAKQFCKEIEFQIGERCYAAIGFENQSGGFELRNRWFKGSSSPKDISLINNNASRVCILEGFIDFLSVKQIANGEMKSLTDNSNFVILNSLSFLNKNVSILKSHEEVVLFLDNDLAGKEAKENLISKGISFHDASKVYHPFKDVNEYLVNGIPKISTSLRSKHLRQGP